MTNSISNISMNRDRIIDAVSIVLECDGEVLTIIRQNFLKNFPGYTAFPGGKVDENDCTTIISAKYLSQYPDDLMNCLVREAMEELRLDIEHEISCDNVTAIEYIAKAVTPDFNPYRFATHFYRISFKQKPTLVIDFNEAASAKWYRPQEVLEEFWQGKRLCVPPVRWVFDALSKNHNKYPLLFEDRFDLTREVPSIESIAGIHQIMPESDTVPPATRTNAFIIGDLLIDPSPKNESELEKFLAVISKHTPKAIFLTHHHADHHQNLPAIIKSLQIPVWASADTLKRIRFKKGASYFQNAATKTIEDGDTVTEWLGHKVLVMAIPGHDEGHLGLYPIGREWFLAGDLFQGIGTVVIGTEEGDMQKYFATLERVIALDPACVIPSHGIALGGTNILQKTLEHRKMRENQILEYAQNELSVDEILQKVYFDIPEVLFKYARLNVESHLIKLRKENRL